MNVTRIDLIKSLYSGSTLSFELFFCAELSILPFYAGWIVYFLSEVVSLKRRILALVHRGPSSETTRLLYKYRGDYYKNILMCVIAVLESISLFPIVISILPDIVLVDSKSSSDFAELIQLANDLKLLTFVLSLVILFLLNTLTKHLINVCKSDYRIQLLPPIQHRLIILTLVLMLMAIVKLAIETLDNLIIEIVCNILACYEFYDIVKNSKQLYYLLKWRYEDMRYEFNLPLYRAHKRIAQKYKYLTIYLLFGISFIMAAGWVAILNDLLFDVLLYTHFPIYFDELLALEVLKWFDRVLGVICSSPQLLVVAVTLYYLAAVCLNKLGWTADGNRIRYLQEPILRQQEYC